MAEWYEGDIGVEKAKVKQAEDKIKRWDADIESYAAEQQRKHQETMKQNQEQLAALKDSLEKFRTQANKNKELMEDKKTKVGTLRTELRDVLSETDGILHDKEAAEEQLEKLRAEINKNKQLLSSHELLTVKNQEEMEKAVSWFKDRLALDIRKVSGDRLQFVFTCIDQKDPKKPYCFCLKLSEDRSYIVSDCKPVVPDFEELAKRLNETNNIRAFVTTMRHRFKSQTIST